MGIDRIGKAVGPAAAPAASGVQRSGETFAIREGTGVGPADSVAGVGPVASTALEQLRAGAIDVAQYVELKVSEATAHLTSLPAAQLDGIRTALRERLESDPALVELREVAYRAAGAAAQADRK